jgi:hypothetical protein
MSARHRLRGYFSLVLLPKIHVSAQKHVLKSQVTLQVSGTSRRRQYQVTKTSL